MQRLGCIKAAFLAFALHEGALAAPLILATNVQGTNCTVTVTLEPTTFSFYGTTLTYTFVGANTISFPPPTPHQAPQQIRWVFWSRPAPTRFSSRLVLLLQRVTR
jgi:hypothetical protein